MRARRLAVRNDAFRSGGGRDAAPRRYAVSRTDSPLLSQGRGQGEGFAVCAANVGEPLTSFLSPPATGEAENAAVTLNSYARRPYHRCNSRAAAFSLVELVLALGVMAFCLYAVFGLMPVGMQTNRNATSQTAATNIIAAIVADLRTTSAAATTSPQFAITFGTDKRLYLDASGQASTSLSPDSRYQLNIKWNSAPTGLHYADLKVTWPAPVDPEITTPSGSVETFAAFDRR
jgi:uncharacterized protein (TIGR02598 family)